MPLEFDGYLSPDFDRWIAKHHAEHRASFDLAERLNRLCQRAMLAAEVPDGDLRALLILSLFARALSSYQGAVLMVERGMSVEAQTLARSCLESTFYLGAVVHNQPFIERIKCSDIKHKKNMATWLTSPAAAVAELPVELIEKLRGFLDKLTTAPGSASSVTIKLAAETAGLLDIYETFYRDLSDRAAHPSLNSLLRHISLDTDGNVVGLRFGPEATDIGDTIFAMTTAMFNAVTFLGSTFTHSDDGAVEIDACWEDYKCIGAALGTGQSGA